jgi:hypothetical protein
MGLWDRTLDSAPMAGHRTRALLAAALFAAACADFAIGAAPVRLDLRGKVRAAATAGPVAGARVTLFAPSDTAATVDSTTTLADGSGNYRLVHTLADKSDCALLHLQAAATGYATTTLPADSIFCMDAAQIVDIVLHEVPQLRSGNRAPAPR